MRKGLNALELIFTLFVLIVVVLVVVRMFITKMSLGGIEKPIQDITDTYNYEAAYSTCSNLCSKYESDCSDIQAAVRFCLQKVNIDINGNRVTGEKRDYNVVEQIPMCEGWIYCFHIKKDCTCGAQRLDPRTCLTILCDYYQDYHGLSPQVAMTAIKNGISWGDPIFCPNDVQRPEWRRIEGFKPIDLTGTGVLMGPDYWYVCGGYDSPSCDDINIPSYC
jgi:hypothetical protein